MVIDFGFFIHLYLRESSLRKFRNRIERIGAVCVLKMENKKNKKQLRKNYEGGTRNQRISTVNIRPNVSRNTKPGPTFTPGVSSS